MTQTLWYWLWRIVFAFSIFFALFKLAAILGFGIKGVAIWTTWVFMLLGILAAGFAYSRLRRIRRRELSVREPGGPAELAEPASNFNVDFADGKERVEMWK